MFSFALVFFHATVVASTGTSGQTTDPSSHHKQYCIIGAGPGGIQLGHFLEQKQRDYVIFEMKATAGNFFQHFPRQRKLISINKRFRGLETFGNRNLTESFAMRHDWNSLLGNATPPMTARTRVLYPHADVLYKYFQDFATGQNIMYNTKVIDVARRAAEAEEEGGEEDHDELKNQLFQVQVVSTTVTNATVKSTTSSPLTTTWSCDHLILANGITIPNKPLFVGHQYVMDYSELPQNGSWADGQRVLVLGLGNAALEVIKSSRAPSTFLLDGLLILLVPLVSYCNDCSRYLLLVTWHLLLVACCLVACQYHFYYPQRLPNLSRAGRRKPRSWEDLNLCPHHGERVVLRKDCGSVTTRTTSETCGKSI